MKNENKTPEEKLSKIEISHLPNKAFKTMVLKMLSKFRREIDELCQNFDKDKKI